MEGASQSAKSGDRNVGIVLSCVLYASDLPGLILFFLFIVNPLVIYFLNSKRAKPEHRIWGARTTKIFLIPSLVGDLMPNPLPFP